MINIIPAITELPDVRELRALGSEPRVHGNGFVQLDLDVVHRLHVWGDPRIPRQRVASPHHDHVFNFTSTVYRGRLIHVEYSWLPSPEGPYVVWEARMAEGHDTKLAVAEGDNRGFLSPKYTRSVLPGRGYGFSKFLIHETFAQEPTVTIMRKQGKTLYDGATCAPRVFLPHGREPDNEFDRHAHSPDLLWSIIEDAIK